MTPVTQALSTALLHFHLAGNCRRGCAGDCAAAVEEELRQFQVCCELPRSGRARPGARGYGLGCVSVFAGSFSRSAIAAGGQERRQRRRGRCSGICCALNVRKLRSVDSAVMGRRRDRVCAPAGVGQWSCLFVAAPRRRGGCIDSVHDSEPGGTRGDSTHDSCVDVVACGSAERGRLDSPGDSSARRRCRGTDAPAAGSSDRARTRARSPSRLLREHPADGRGNASFLSPCGLVGLLEDSL